MKSVEKTIKILNCLSDAEKSLGVTEITSLLFIPKSTVHRILSTLLCHSLVIQDKETSKYRLGIQVLKYANSFYNSFDFRQLANNLLKDICLKTNLTTYLSIWQNDNIICIDSINLTNKTNTHQLFVEVGKVMPFHCTASAKILLAYQSSCEISNIIKNKKLNGYTANTITEPDKLIKHLELIRIQGYAICDEELEEGIRAISVPVKDLNGNAIASITITGLINRIPRKKFDYFIETLTDAAEKVSNKVGYKRNLF